MKILIVTLALSTTPAWADCTLGGKPFVAKYGVFWIRNNKELDVTVLEAKPATADEKKQACRYQSGAPFATKVSTRTLSLWSETATDLTKANVAFHADESKNDLATKQSVELKNKHLKLTATFNAGTCTVELPVEQCESTW